MSVKKAKKKAKKLAKKSQLSKSEMIRRDQ
jgi:hypothetical protein